MPQGGAAKKIEPQPSDKNRSSSNAAKRTAFTAKPTPANDNASAATTLRGVPQGATGTKTLRGQPQTSPGAKTLRGIGPSTPKTAPRPTGAGSASPVGKKSPKNASRSVGPGAITRPVNPMQLASRLQSDQQQSRMDDAPGTGPTREEMLANSGTGGNQILGGQFDPLQGQGSFGQEAKAPGSMSESAPSDAEERGGGPMMSDLERQRAMQLNQAQMSATAGTAGMAGGLMSGTEDETRGQTDQRTGSIQQTGQTTEETQETTEQTPAGQKQPDKTGSDIQTAQNIAAAMHMDKTAKALAVADAAKGNLEAMRKAQKAAQTFWNIIKGAETLTAATVFSLILLYITLNVQVINKYTFKNRIIPPTFLIEDMLTICLNCMICGGWCIATITSPVIIIIIILSAIVTASVLDINILNNVISLMGL